MQTTAMRGHTELARGLRLHADGPVHDAYASLSLARSELGEQPGAALTATLAAVNAAWSAGDHVACVEALTTALGQAALDGAPRDYLTGMLALLHGRTWEAAGPLRRVVRGALAGHDPEALLRGAAAALLTGDVQDGCRAGARALAAARAADDPALVARATEYVAYAELRAGRHAQAREHALTGLRAAEQSRRANTAAHHHAVLALTAAVQGPSGDVVDHATTALATAGRHGLTQPVTLAEWALARTELVEGRPADAASRLVSLLASAEGAHFALRGLVLPTLVEAAVGAGDRATGRAALPELARWSRTASDPQGPALLLRCRALLCSTEAEADALFREAHAAHLEAGGRFESAVTFLLHGRRLGRHGRPSDARERLRDALLLFERGGADPWADRTRTELRAAEAAGETSVPDVLTGLTPHQLRIARRVAAGETNREIAERLSVSVRTVDCHLRNIFVLLGIRSRVELALQVPPSTGAAAQ